MSVKLAEVEVFVEGDLCLDFLRRHLPGLRVVRPFEALEWADQDLGRKRDELPQRLVAMVAASWVLTLRLACVVEVTPDDVGQSLALLDTHKVGEQIILGVRRNILRSQKALGLARFALDFFVRDETKDCIEGLNLTDAAGK